MIANDLVIIPTITPQQKKNGECVFFENGKCTVHPVKPFGCGFFDHHMSDQEADLRAKSQMISCMGDEEYQAAWDALRLDGVLARPIMARKQALGKLILQIEEKENNKTG